jgi:hypothetical protein
MAHQRQSYYEADDADDDFAGRGAATEEEFGEDGRG